MAKWAPQNGEERVTFDAVDEVLYKSKEPGDLARCTHRKWAWPLDYRQGRFRGGCFPEVVARAYFEKNGYRVLLSAPAYPDSRGYLVLHYRQKRLAGDPAFKRMQRQFPRVDLHEVAEQARAVKLKRCNSGGGGDPDLFVYKPATNERFFVEVKYRDELICNQLVCFPLIERALCEVRVVRIVPRHAAASR